MLLNDLIDDCLWLIFDNFFELEELIQLSKVCSKWSNLIDLRFKKVKYLLNRVTIKHLDHSKVWMEDPETIEVYDLRELLPNLRAIDLFPYVGDKPWISSNYRPMVDNNPKIKGLVDLTDGYNLNLENIEMVAMDNKMMEYKKLFCPDQLKQIYFDCAFDLNDLNELVEYFPNLKRINVKFCGKPVRYDGPNLFNLKIFESTVDGQFGTCNAIHVMDFCPSLESAYICDQSDDEFTNMARKNYNLRDLVIVNTPSTDNLTWPFLRKLFSKYPNLHNLAIDGGYKMDDSRVTELVKLLPMIKLMDFRGSKSYC
ncbi:uncharacterized protein LOC128386252 [Panonychus citri]|uniref:uncharacterized protein LOC128386252 n=1 Tax=Panonychus citri TaxID=50023 RepID=UPI00230700F6|nr:uncharacterized protein LOC128386252 [Panonychus citri]